MGPIAELLAGQGQQLGLAAGRGINADAGDDALQQCGVTVPEMAQQQVAQVALAVAMAQQQHRIGGLDRQGDLLEIGMVKGGPLPGDVTVVAMAEVFTAGPEAMGPQHGLIDGLAIEAKQTGLAMVKNQHQPPGLIPAGGIGHGLGMAGADAGCRQQVAQPLDRLGIESARRQPTTTGMDPAARTPGKDHLQARSLPVQVGTEGRQQSLHLGQAQAMGQGMAPEQGQGALVMTAEFRHRLVGHDCPDADDAGVG